MEIANGCGSMLYIIIITRYDMEGRITTQPTTSGVQKRARQSKAEGISKPNIAKPYNCQTLWA
jgi:hypothetical protein